MNEIRGIREIIDKLNALPDKLRNKAVRSAVRKGANIIRDAARSKVPIKTGNLRKSIITSNSRTKNKDIVASKVRLAQRKSKKASSPFYGYFIEFGTSKMVAKPFLRPALDEKESEVLSTTMNEIKIAVDELNK